MKKILLVLIAAIGCFSLKAQLLTWSPAFPTEGDASQVLIITMDATKGNKGLQNYTPATDVYIHLGVITNYSANASDWKHVKFSQNFNQPNPNLQATRIGNNQWKFTINGSLRDYFGVTDAAEKIQKIALLFRNGNGSVKQANTDNSDMYIPVYTTALAVRIDQPYKQPTYTPIPEPQTLTIGSAIAISAVANKPSALKIYHNGTLVNSSASANSLTATSTVTSAGNQQIIAAATDGTVTTYDTLNIFVAPTSANVAPLPAGVREGINYETGNTSVVLVLHAAGKNRVSVIGDFNNWTEDILYSMNKTPDGKDFWIRVSNLTPGTEYAYQYKVDDAIKIADPYAEKILDPNNDPSIPATTYPSLKAYPTGKTTGIVSVLQPAQPVYTWTTNNYTQPDKRSLVIYELLVRDFVANHDWNTLRDTLGYLKRLGINAIEVMPFNEFEGNNSWGYNPDFYFAPDKYYGTKNSLKAFVDACHSSGIAVVMDIALNHSFGSSPMVQLYYDAANNRPSADNPWFNPVAKHAYNVGYDMNHESLDTRYFVSRVVEHWLTEYKIDGFRFDLAKGFTQKQTCDANGGNCDVAAWSAYDASRVAIWKRYYDTVQTKKADSYVILEHFADNSEEKELADYGMLLWGNMNYNYNEASMGYLTNSDFSGGIYTVRGWTKPHLVTYMESHDEERLMYKNKQYGNAAGSYTIKDILTGLKRVELDAAFFFTIPGPKMIWQFGELGYDYSINTCENGTVDNNCRTNPKPIKWDYLQNGDRKHVYDEFSNLIKLRFHPWYKDAFISGKIDRNLMGAFKWIKVSTDTSNLLVVGNFDVTTASGTVTFQSGGTWYDYLNNSTFTTTGTEQSITLQPGEFHVFLNRNLNNVTTTPVSNIPRDNTMLEVVIYPNPVKGASYLELNLPQSSTVTIGVINSMGQQVTGLDPGFLVKGKHQLPLTNLAKLAAGNYYLKISTKLQSSTLQIIIL